MFIDLTHTLKSGIAAYHDDPQFCVSSFATISNNGFNCSELKMCSHTGTHMDAPLHFLNGSDGCSDIPISFTTGTALIIEGKIANNRLTLDMPLPKTEFLLIYSGAKENLPELEESTLNTILKMNYKGIGTDAMSVDTDGAFHKLLLNRGTLIFENLANLEYNIGKNGIFHAAPLKIENGDGSPVRAYLEWCPKIRGAIFDVDGTILESMTVWEQVTTNFYAINGLVLEREEAILFQEMTMDESMPYIKNKYKLNMTVPEMSEKFKELIKEEYEQHLQAKPYVVEYIKKLHTNGVKLAIATSGYPEFCRAAFKRLGIEDLFENYTLSSEVGVNKSHPDVYLLAASRMKLPPEECMVFEDIPTGIKGAKKGGFLTCAVYDDTNIHFTEKLREYADIYIKSWKELL